MYAESRSLLMHHEDRSYPEHGLSDLDGDYRWCKDSPSSPCDLESWFHARNEGQLDYFPAGSRFRAEVPSRAHLGPVLQRYRVLHWNICQLRHKEEAPCGFEKETFR